MKKLHILRRMVAFVLIACVGCTCRGSIRRRPVQKPGQTGSSQSSSNKSKSAQTPAEEDSKSRSDKPLADNTPVTVTDDGTIKLENFDGDHPSERL
ncbi:MAG: hypothetical protein IPG76_20335 [Acidobacteria bacterium]|nr:hypothetical protein [Acidobacteriota bacterium]